MTATDLELLGELETIYELPKSDLLLPELEAPRATSSRCTPAGRRVGKFTCSNADVAAIKAFLSRPRLAAPVLRAAVEAAAGQAVSLARRAADALDRARRTADTRSTFCEAFGVPPEFVPSWRASLRGKVRWRDLGELVAIRLRSAAKILDGGCIHYFCWGSSSHCPECTGSPTEYFACSSFRGKYLICIGGLFWQAWQSGDSATTGSTLLHEALHIYFSSTVSDTGRSGNANCYERFAVRLQNLRLHPATAGNCPAGSCRATDSTRLTETSCGSDDELKLEEEIELPKLTASGLSARTGPFRRSAPAFANLGRQQTLRQTLSGFRLHAREAGSLPPSERGRIESIARFIVGSHASGARPILAVRIIGHADLDTPRRPAFERRISYDRARSIGRALQAAVARIRPALVRQIRWEHFSMGATRPLVSAPRTEAERARNRRVDIQLEAIPRRTTARIARMQEFAEPQPTPPPKCVDPARKQSATIRFGGIVFNAEVATTAFNPMARGVVQPVVLPFKVQALQFSSHRVTADKDCMTYFLPAWAFEGAVSAKLPAGEKEADWEYGFAQTIQRSRLLHFYEGGTGRECIISSPTRDAQKGSPTPWYMAAGVTVLGSDKPAFMEDSPSTVARITHPTRPGLSLRQVCLEGVFQIWLMARKKNAAMRPVLLIYKEITVGRTWEFIVDPRNPRDPTDPQAWVAYGGQFESQRGDGTMAKLPTPELNGSTANEELGACFKSVADKRCKTSEQPEFNSNCIVGGVCLSGPRL